MTNKLYLNLPLQYQWESEVLSYEKVDHYYELILRDTIFYPQSLSGQYGDQGYIQNVKVSRVYEADQKIVHVLKSPLDQATKSVKLEIDQDRRLGILRYQTAQLLLSYVLYEIGRIKIRNFSFFNDYAFVDISRDHLQNLDLATIEKAIHTLIERSLPITVQNLSKEKCGQSKIFSGVASRANNRTIKLGDLGYAVSDHIFLPHTGMLNQFMIAGISEIPHGSRITFIVGKTVNDNLRLMRRNERDIKEFIGAGHSTILETLTKNQESYDSLKNDYLLLLELTSQMILKDTSPLKEIPLVSYFNTSAPLSLLRILADKTKKSNQISVLATLNSGDNMGHLLLTWPDLYHDLPYQSLLRKAAKSTRISSTLGEDHIAIISSSKDIESLVNFWESEISSFFPHKKRTLT